MNPSRIVYGPKNSCSLEFNNIVSKSLNHSNYKVRFMESVEAEAVKLFSNTYLNPEITDFRYFSRRGLTQILWGKYAIKLGNFAKINGYTVIVNFDFSAFPCKLSKDKTQSQLNLL